VTALCLVTFFAGLGRSAIGDADEAFYAQSAREMVEQGDWITPHYNYEYRFQKPVFFYWMVAVAYTVAGVSETAARFPSALAGLALALMTWAIGRRWVGASAGVVGGAIVATSFGYFTIAHASLPDLPARPSNNAGGLEGGVTNGQDVRVTGFMKPIATLMNPLRSVDLTTMENAPAAIERSDVCAVPAAAVVGEAMVSLVLADALLEKFGGDSINEIVRHFAATAAQVAARLAGTHPVER